METCAEQLPIELWLTTFSYIEIHSLFQAFSNLNNYFDKLLASHQLLFYVKLESRQVNYNSESYRSKFNWSNSILNRIKCLQSSAIYQTSNFPQFLEFYSEKLIRLQSLIIQSPIQEIPSICNALENLSSLRYLSVACIPTQQLLEAILAAPNLCMCQLKFWKPTSTINYDSGTNSNVRVLYAKFLDDPNHAILNILLSHMPKLKRLEIEEFDSVPLFKQELFVLEQLKTLKFIWNFRDNKLNYSDNCLKVVPCLKRLYLATYYYKLDELMDDKLIHFLSRILKKLKSIKIYILCHQLMKIIDNDIRIKIEDYCQQLLSKLNTQANATIEIKWSENSSFEHQIELFLRHNQNTC